MSAITVIIDIVLIIGGCGGRFLGDENSGFTGGFGLSVGVGERA
jgi:hypothetical protein